MRLRTGQIRCMLMAAALVTSLLAVSSGWVDAAERIRIGKRYQGGVEFTAKPNIVIAQWRMTIDSITTEHSLMYKGMRSETTAMLETRVVERNSVRQTEKQVHQDSVLIKFDCGGDVLQKIEPLTFAMRLADGSLKYTVLADWDTIYIDPDTAFLRCRFGHEWLRGNRDTCPICGARLERGKS